MLRHEVRGTDLGGEPVVVRVVVAPIADSIDDGAGPHLSLQLSDITSLRRSETRYRTLAESVPVGIFEMDRSGRFVDVTPLMETLVATPGTLIGRLATDFVHPDHQDRVRLHFARALAGRGYGLILVDDRPGPRHEVLAAELGVPFRPAPAPSDDAGWDAVLAGAVAFLPTPGLPERHPAFAAARRGGLPTISEFDLAAAWDDRPLVAITGTNGKTTVTMMVTAMFNRSGRTAAAVGNTDVPLEGNGANGKWGKWEELEAPLSERKWYQFSQHPKKLKPAEWLLEVFSSAERADTRPIFLIHHPELLGELKLQAKGVEKSGLRYYTFNERKAEITIFMFGYCRLTKLWVTFGSAKVHAHAELALIRPLSISPVPNWCATVSRFRNWTTVPAGTDSVAGSNWMNLCLPSLARASRVLAS